MRVRFQKQTNQADHLRAFQRGGHLQIAHQAYGGGLLGSDIGAFALRHLVIPAGKGAAKGAVTGLFTEQSGSYSDKMKRGAIKGAVAGVLKGGGSKKKGKAKRPF